MAAGAQNLLLALAVPLISPFELQHQIFREHPAPEQLFLIATPQHCCPCLYINIYSEPRTEHQSSALPPPPARPGRASPAASPSTAAAAPAGPEGGCAETDLGPTVLLLLHRLGWTRPCPVPCALCPPPAPRLPAGPCEEREARSTTLRSSDAPVPASGAASLGTAPPLPLTAMGPDSPSSPLPRHRCLQRARAELVKMRHDGLEEAEGGGRLCGLRCWSTARPREQDPDLGWLGVLPVPPG